MRRKLPVLSFYLLLAMASLGVSAAGAAAAQFHSVSSPTFLKGEQTTENVFTFSAGTAKCKKVVYTSTEEVGTSRSTIELTPSFSECTAMGQEATISDPECHLEYTAASPTSGTVTLKSTGVNCKITIATKTAGCHITITPQAPTSPSVDWRNIIISGVKDIIVKLLTSGWNYVSTGGICGASGTNGKLTGEVLIKGYKSASFTTQQGIWVE